MKINLKFMIRFAGSEMCVNALNSFHCKKNRRFIFTAKLTGNFATSSFGCNLRSDLFHVNSQQNTQLNYPTLNAVFLVQNKRLM